MQDAVILIAAGTDQPGIVDRISGVIFDCGCNLEDSRMSLLGGEFALMVLVRGSPSALRELEGSAIPVADELGLLLQIRPTGERQNSGSRVADAICYRLHAVAMDHPGIVHKITRLLREHQINVVRLDSEMGAAPTTGTPIFSLHLEMHVPASVPVARLRADLQSFAEEENIDISLTTVG